MTNAMTLFGICVAVGVVLSSLVLATGLWQATVGEVAISAGIAAIVTTTILSIGKTI